jgi:hypothetical protein
VFLSRNLVAPEVFDAVHDALRLNGANVLLCADPSRTGPLDFHVISSSSHVRRRALGYSESAASVSPIPNNAWFHFGVDFCRRSSPI